MAKVTNNYVLHLKERTTNGRTKRKYAMGYVRSAVGNVYTNDFTTGVRLDDGEKFDRKNWCVLNANGKIVVNKTAQLQLIRDKLHRAYAGLLLSGQEITAQTVFRFAFPDRKPKPLKEPRKPKSMTIQDAFDHLLAQTEKEHKAGEVTYDNLRKQKGHAGLICEWSRHEFQKQHVALTEIKPGHLKALILWAKVEKKYNHNYAGYIAKYFKRVMAHSLANGFIIINPVANIIIKKETVMKDTLTVEEVAQLVNFDRSRLTDQLAMGLDNFLWQLFTGASYEDSVSMTHDNLLTHVDGTRFLSYQRGKVKKKGAGFAIVPLLPQAAALLDKYQDHPLRIAQGVLMPGRSYDKTNKGLALICRLAGITKHVTTHTARRTFATLFLNEGVQLATVSKMLGHSNTATTERHYAQLKPEGVIREMQPFLISKNA